MMDIQKQSHTDTKARILDAAERLFALKGFQRTTIRHLANGAGANQAAINYHFGSKMGLIKKVIERRLKPINRQRMLRLEAVRQAAVENGCRPLAKDVLRAFIEPALVDNSSPQEKRCFTALAGRALWEPDATIRTLFLSQFTQPFKLLLQTMIEALPDLPEDVLLWRLHFATGAMSHCMGLISADFTAPDLFLPVDNVNKTTELLLDFVTTGVCAPYSQKGRR